jgi:hypothetical protein
MYTKSPVADDAVGAVIRYTLQVDQNDIMAPDVLALDETLVPPNTRNRENLNKTTLIALINGTLDAHILFYTVETGSRRPVVYICDSPPKSILAELQQYPNEGYTKFFPGSLLEFPIVYRVERTAGQTNRVERTAGQTNHYLLLDKDAIRDKMTLELTLQLKQILQKWLPQKESIEDFYTAKSSHGDSFSKFLLPTTWDNTVKISLDEFINPGPGKTPYAAALVPKLTYDESLRGQAGTLEWIKCVASGTSAYIRVADIITDLQKEYEKAESIRAGQQVPEPEPEPEPEVELQQSTTRETAAELEPQDGVYPLRQSKYGGV